MNTLVFILFAALFIAGLLLIRKSRPKNSGSGNGGGGAVPDRPKDQEDAHQTT